MATNNICSLSLKTASPATDALDALVVATTTDGKTRLFNESLTPAVKSKIESALKAMGATGAVEEVIKLSGAGITKAPVIVAVGLGSVSKAGGLSDEQLRRGAGAAIRALAGTKKVGLAIPALHSQAAGAILEGVALSAYSFTDHRVKTLNKSKSPVASAVLFVDDAKAKEYRAALSRARAIASAVIFARDLINTSPLHLPPAELAVRALDHLAQSEVTVEVFDEKALLKGGFGGIMGVGQGSARPPRLIRMQYQPAGATAHVSLIGKGITFDTGGISLKPPASMHEMKADMSGAAAVIATIKLIADLELPLQVTAYAACAENMPGGGAQRPGDVITAYGGRTIEVLNTDAEGRLVLADAIVRASEDKPDVILDIATLTGAATVALGHRYAGVMGTDSVRDAVKASADRAGENFWPMPLPEELRGYLDSLVADIANIGQREGGMLSGAVFLKEFVPNNQPWAHLDIAPPAFNSQSSYGYTPKGGVGFGVRTMLAFCEDVASGTHKF